MSLIAIIGSGAVGQYAAENIGRVVPEHKIIGLEGTRSWLSATSPASEFIATLDFDGCLRALKRLEATEVVFAGNSADSFQWRIIDALTLKYTAAQVRSLWSPHAFLAGIRRMLNDHNIGVRSPLEFFPELNTEIGFIAGERTEYSPSTDVEAVRQHLARQSWKRIWQTHIVDRGRVLMSESKGLKTNDLIEAYGRSYHRDQAVFPVLCKLTVAPFEKIDTPTIGATTVRLGAENGLRAIIVEGGKSILMERDRIELLVSSTSMSIHAV